MKRKVVDAHIHYWDPGRLAYPWLSSVPSIAQPHLPEHLQAQEKRTDRFRLEKIVFVQAGAQSEDALKEARWIDELASTQEPRIAGIVADAPVHRGREVARTLEPLQAIARVKGVRSLIQDQPLGHAVTPAFQEGVQALSAYGFSFDICIRHAQLGEATRLVQACPDVRFILDHIAKPDIKAQLFAPWKTQIQALSALPNVACKISGMVSEADWAQWKPADLQPYVDHVIECFGIDRVLYGGDWPVSLLAVRHWGAWVDALDDLTPWLGADEKQKLFYANAIRVYGL